MNNIDNSIYSPYIYGLPNKETAEAVADKCLCLPRSLWGERNVEWIADENLHYEPRYSSMGCLRGLFCYTIEPNETKCTEEECQCCYIGGVICLAGIGYSIASIVAKPLDWIGTYLKKESLEMNKEAKDYNQMASTHLKMIKDFRLLPQNKWDSSILKTLEESASIQKIVDDLKISLKKLSIILNSYNEIFDLIINATQQPSIDPIIINHTKKKDWLWPPINWEMKLTLHPIYTHKTLLEYEISCQSSFIPHDLGKLFPTTRVEFSKKIHSLEIKIQKIKQEIQENEELIYSIQECSKDFEYRVKNLLNSGEEELSLIQENQY